MRKHTPGPWKFSRWDQFGDARFYISQEEGAPYTPNYSDVATLIAETPSGERVRIQEANARLIAAAPDLLDALSSIDVYLSDTLSGRVNPDPATYKQWLIDGIIEARNRARAAIAKATGEQT